MNPSTPIYIINLSRTPERRLHIQRQLETLSLEYEFVDAIDKYELESKAYRMRIAQQLDIEESTLENKYAAIIDHTKTQENGSGQLANTLSHIKIYNLMVKKNVGWVCIREDDATLLPTFPAALKIAFGLECDMLLKEIILGKHRLSLVKHEQYIKHRTLRQNLKVYTFIQLGALSNKTSLKSNNRKSLYRRTETWTLLSYSLFSKSINSSEMETQNPCSQH